MREDRLLRFHPEIARRIQVGPQHDLCEAQQAAIESAIKDYRQLPSGERSPIPDSLPIDFIQFEKRVLEDLDIRAEDVVRGKKGQRKPKRVKRKAGAAKTPIEPNSRKRARVTGLPASGAGDCAKTVKLPPLPALPSMSEMTAMRTAVARGERKEGSLKKPVESKLKRTALPLSAQVLQLDVEGKEEDERDDAIDERGPKVSMEEVERILSTAGCQGGQEANDQNSLDCFVRIACASPLPEEAESLGTPKGKRPVHLLRGKQVRTEIVLTNVAAGLRDGAVRDKGEGQAPSVKTGVQIETGKPDQMDTGAHVTPTAHVAGGSTPDMVPLRGSSSLLREAGAASETGETVATTEGVASGQTDDAEILAMRSELNLLNAEIIELRQQRAKYSKGIAMGLPSNCHASVIMKIPDRPQAPIADMPDRSTFATKATSKEAFSKIMTEVNEAVWKLSQSVERAGSARKGLAKVSHDVCNEFRKMSDAVCRREDRAVEYECEVMRKLAWMLTMRVGESDLQATGARRYVQKIRRICTDLFSIRDVAEVLLAEWQKCGYVLMDDDEPPVTGLENVSDSESKQRREGAGTNCSRSPTTVVPK